MCPWRNLQDSMTTPCPFHFGMLYDSQNSASLRAQGAQHGTSSLPARAGSAESTPCTPAQAELAPPAGRGGVPNRTALPLPEELTPARATPRETLHCPVCATARAQVHSAAQQCESEPPSPCRCQQNKWLVQQGDGCAAIVLQGSQKVGLKSALLLLNSHWLQTEMAQTGKLVILQ